MIRRNVDLTRPQREPPDVHANSAAYTDSHGEMRPADPRDQRGSIHRTHIGNGNDARRARYPTPAAANIDPATIVEGRKAPRRIIHPRPAPRRDPGPVAVAIGRPVNNGNVREPDRAVFRHLAPAAVVVEVFVADHVIGNVAARHRVLFAVIALATPAIEIVVALQIFYVRIQRIGAGENALLARMNRVGRAAAGHFARALGNVDNGGVAGFIDVDAIAAGTQDGKSKVGRIHLDGFLVVEAKHVKIDGAFGDAKLHHSVVQIQERQTGLTGQADHGGTHIEFGTRALVGPEFVAGGHGAIDYSGDPIIGAGGTEGNFSVGVAQTGYAAGRIVLVIVLGHSWFCGGQNKSKDKWDEGQPLQCTCLHVVPFSPDAFRLWMLRRAWDGLGRTPAFGRNPLGRT